MYEETTEAVREASPIEKVTMEMRAAVESAQEVAEVLRERLRPLLRPSEEKKQQDGVAPHAVRSPLIEQLAGQVAGIQMVTRRLHEIIHELDI